LAAENRVLIWDIFGDKTKRKYPMTKGYHHLTTEERAQIEALKKQGVTQKNIAKTIGKSEACISNELKRNRGKRGYSYQQAHQKATTRRRQASQMSGMKMVDRTKKLVIDYIKEDWSPVQISGYLAKEHNISISHETIYKYIWADKKKGGTLCKHLRHKGKKYNKRSGKNAGRGLIPGRIDIKERPAIVETKQRIGDFEIDTIIGKNHKGAIVSIVDRRSKYTKLILVEKRTANLVSAALLSALGDLSDKVHTLTADNGKEFAEHAKVAAALNAAVYFATPYHSWERGLNEHTNGLVRQYFPKKTDFATLTQADVSLVEQKLNRRPRKELDFNTPENVFFQTDLAA